MNREFLNKIRNLKTKLTFNEEQRFNKELKKHKTKYNCRALMYLSFILLVVLMSKFRSTQHLGGTVVYLIVSLFCMMAGVQSFCKGKMNSEDIVFVKGIIVDKYKESRGKGKFNYFFEVQLDNSNSNSNKSIVETYETVNCQRYNKFNENESIIFAFDDKDNLLLIPGDNTIKELGE